MFAVKLTIYMSLICLPRTKTVRYNSEHIIAWEGWGNYFLLSSYFFISYGYVCYWSYFRTASI